MAYGYGAMSYDRSSRIQGCSLHAGSQSVLCFCTVDCRGQLNTSCPCKKRTLYYIYERTSYQNTDKAYKGKLKTGKTSNTQ
eukprot:6088029-Pleurochrysis_carterae.AAC.2